jgi:hypothetical protein
VCFGTSVISENADKLCTDPLPILWWGITHITKN